MKRFEVGARVVDPTYGFGSVVAVEDAYTRIQLSDEPLPPPSARRKARRKKKTAAEA